MRPLRLELEGFATFRQRTVLDFDGLELVAFTGPTGAGKSTIIDAITFALYGSVARYDNANVVAPVIHQLANEAKVRLDFELGGIGYTAVRVLRRTKAGASTREARLERFDGRWGLDEATTSVAGSVKELDEMVVKLLGLDFAQFTRTIVLPQGEFAQFLRDEPASRQRLLRRLLDLEIYSRMGTLARDEAKRSAQQVEVIEAERDRHLPADKQTLSVLVERLEALDELRAGLDARLLELTEIEAALIPLRSRCTAIDHLVERLDDLAAPPPAVSQDSEELAAAEKTLELAASALIEARSERDAALEAMSGLSDRATLMAALGGLRQRIELDAEIDEARTQIEERESSRERLDNEAAAALEELEMRESELALVRNAASAHEWTATLVVGEPCPVCHQEVGSVPSHDVGAELASATNLVKKATEASKTASAAAVEAAAAAKASSEAIERLKARRALVLKATGGEANVSPSAIAGIEDEIELVGLAEHRRDEATRRVAAAEARVERAEVGLKELAAMAKNLRLELATARDGVVELGPPTLDGSSLAEDWASMTSWAQATAVQLRGERTKLADEGKNLAQKKEGLDSTLRGEAEALGVSAAPDRLVEQLAIASGEARSALQIADERRATYERLVAQALDLAELRDLNRMVGLHLQANYFEGWLLDEALETIVRRATVWLLDLSRGQYSLVVDERQFAILDHANADERRDVRTLSGGETFLASLALALALADSISDLAPVDAPRLESMFLDEGFGTLDPETLDVVAVAIEELASTGRLIGIVTHVAELAERMPARFEVRKGPTGSSASLVGLEPVAAII